MLKIVQAGFLATVQDRGRCARYLGFTSGGAMDQNALKWANYLLDNPIASAAIEITYGAFACVAERPCWVAVAGADLHAKLNDVPISPWRNLRLAAGDHLQFTHPREGLRAYLAIQGGFDTPEFLNSRSTVVREQLLGINGRALEKGDILAARVQNAPTSVMRNLCVRALAEWEIKMLTSAYQQCSDSKVIELDFYPSCQWQMLGDAVQRQFLQTIYQIGNQSNRMGYRLQGDALPSTGLSLVSEGLVAGSIQLPSDGQPIVLMRDHPTIGGYPKLGVVTAKSMDVLAQLMPQRSVSFRPVDFAL